MNAQLDFFETTYLEQPQLAEAKHIASLQNAVVLSIFYMHGERLSPSQVWLFGKEQGLSWLLTSVRRSMTVLSTGEHPKLMKLDEQREGAYSRPEHVWQLCR